MKKLYFLLLLLSLSRVLVAQQTEAMPPAVNFNESKRAIINKGRDVLLEKFLQRDLAAVKAVKDSLLKLEDGNYQALFPRERWLLMYWTKEYKPLLADVQTYVGDQFTNAPRKIAPQPDMLFLKLREHTRTASVLIASDIAQSALGQEQKDFLDMHLLSTLASNDYTLIKQDTLNHMANRYLLHYPQSPYVNYTRYFIRNEYKPSKWGFAVEFFSGYGAFTDDLASKFTNNVPIGVAFDVSYKNWVLNLRDYIGFCTTKEAQDFSTVVWEKNKAAQVFVPEASIGYVLVDGNRIKFAPFAGIASTSIVPPNGDVKKNAAYDDAGLDFTTTYTWGANLDLKLFAKARANTQDPSFPFVRLRYAYNTPQFNKNYQGAMHSFTIGVGVFGRAIKRQL